MMVRAMPALAVFVICATVIPSVCANVAIPAAPPRLSTDFDLVQNATFFQFVPGADGFMVGTGTIHTANIMHYAFLTHWRCFGVAPAEGAVLNRYDMNRSWYLFNFSSGVPQSCIALPPTVQPDPWGWLYTRGAVYVGRGVADCGATDTWATTAASNMTAVSVCSATPSAPVYASQFTARYFAGGNVKRWTDRPSKAVFSIPGVCNNVPAMR